MSNNIEMTWDCCGGENCFNIKKRLKFGVFKAALERAGLPEKISFSDIDGFFERNGYFFFVEWKEVGVPLNNGQRIAFERLTAQSDKFVAFSVSGDAEFMTCTAWRSFYKGEESDEVFGNIDDFCALIEAWAEVAECRTFNQEVINRRRASRVKLSGISS